MIKKRPIRYLVILIAAIFLVMSVVNIASVVVVFTKSPENSGDQGQDVQLKAFELVDQALETKTQAYTFTFKGSFDPPFRPILGVKRRKTGGVAKPKQVYKKLLLKGTLIKDNALAIIEDEDGKTFICKQGDLVHNRVIGTISEDKVIIRDKGGTTELKVRDK